MKLSDLTTLAEIAAQHNLNYHTVRYRVRKRRIATVRKAGVVWVKRSDVKKVVVK